MLRTLLLRSPQKENSKKNCKSSKISPLISIFVSKKRILITISAQKRHVAGTFLISIHESHALGRLSRTKQGPGHCVGKALEEILVKLAGFPLASHLPSQSTSSLSCTIALATNLLTYLGPTSILASPAF